MHIGFSLGRYLMHILVEPKGTQLAAASHLKWGNHRCLLPLLSWNISIIYDVSKGHLNQIVNLLLCLRILNIDLHYMATVSVVLVLQTLAWLVEVTTGNGWQWLPMSVLLYELHLIVKVFDLAAVVVRSIGIRQTVVLLLLLLSSDHV